MIAHTEFNSDHNDFLFEMQVDVQEDTEDPPWVTLYLTTKAMCMRLWMMYHPLGKSIYQCRREILPLALVPMLKGALCYKADESADERKK
jgi:hypothetical protein